MYEFKFTLDKKPTRGGSKKVAKDPFVSDDIYHLCSEDDGHYPVGRQSDF
jgi:hypothetical protein